MYLYLANNYRQHSTVHFLIVISDPIRLMLCFRKAAKKMPPLMARPLRRGGWRLFCIVPMAINLEVGGKAWPGH